MVQEFGPFSPAYRAEAIRLVVEIGHPIEFVSEKLQIPVAMLSEWVEEHLEEFEGNI